MKSRPWQLPAALILDLLLGIWCFGQEPRELSVDQRRAIEEGLSTLEKTLHSINKRSTDEAADAAIFDKGVRWALRYDQTFSSADLRLLEKAIARGIQRAESLAAGKMPWYARRGRLALGFVSRVDSSVQPYGVIVPKNYVASRPWRLDVVL